MLQGPTNSCTFLGIKPHQLGLRQPLDRLSSSSSAIGQSSHRDTSGRTLKGTHSHQAAQQGGAAQGDPSYSKSSPQVSHLVSSAVSSSSGGICAQKRAHSAAEGTGSARRTAAARMSAATEGTKMRRMVSCVSCVSWSEARLSKKGRFRPLEPPTLSRPRNPPVLGKRPSPR